MRARRNDFASSTWSSLPSQTISALFLASGVALEAATVIEAAWLAPAVSRITTAISDSFLNRYTSKLMLNSNQRIAFQRQAGGSVKSNFTWSYRREEP